MKYCLPEPPNGGLNALKSYAKKASLHVHSLSRVWRKTDTHGVGVVHLDFLSYSFVLSAIGQHEWKQRQGWHMTTKALFSHLVA